MNPGCLPTQVAQHKTKYIELNLPFVRFPPMPFSIQLCQTSETQNFQFPPSYSLLNSILFQISELTTDLKLLWQRRTWIFFVCDKHSGLSIVFTLPDDWGPSPLETQHTWEILLTLEKGEENQLMEYSPLPSPVPTIKS